MFTYSINKPPCFDFKYFHNGCASLPLTSTFSNMSNLTFCFAVKLQILSASPGSYKIYYEIRNGLSINKYE